MSVKRRFRYIHIWCSDEEARVKCTDQMTLEAVVTAIVRSGERSPVFATLDIQRFYDISGYLNLLVISGFEDGRDYARLAWWLFRALCDRGWQPLVTAEHTYKLVYEEEIPAEESEGKWEF